MTNEEKNRLYDQLYERFGIRGQIMQTLEEFAELQKELSKWYRGMPDAVAIADEIADVEIMLDQIKYFLEIPDELIREKTEKKLVRTMERYGKTETEEIRAQSRKDYEQA